MAEQPAVNRFVVGSSPILSANLWPVGEAVNSYPFQGYIHAFEPRTGHHLKITDPGYLGSVFLISTDLPFRVVHLIEEKGDTNGVQGGKKEMNTDKIYAEKIASEYAPKKENKVNALHKLDNKAKLPSTIFAYVYGIVSALILGVGMCLAMGTLAAGESWAMPLGIVIGIIGLFGAATNYPIYRVLLQKGKKKYAYEIMELAKDIANEK